MTNMEIGKVIPPTVVIAPRRGPRGSRVISRKKPTARAIVPWLINFFHSNFDFLSLLKIWIPEVPK